MNSTLGRGPKLLGVLLGMFIGVSVFEVFLGLFKDAIVNLRMKTSEYIFGCVFNPYLSM